MVAKNPRAVEASKRWNRLNRERLAQATREWKARNPERAKEAVRSWKARNPEKIAEYRRKQNAKPSTKAKGRADVRLYRLRHPEKRRAHSAVAKALASGRLSKGACEVCCDPTSHAHHDDYSKPLQVRWLCRKHHVEHHIKERK